jgi:spermidine synthase
MNKKKIFLYLVVFGTGVSILAIELAASRLLAPYFGTSIFVWGNIIGVILIALSLGYWMGGKLADQHPSQQYLMYLLAVAGVLTSLIPLIFPWYIRGLEISGSFIIFLLIGSLLAMLLLFFLPIFILGMVSPWAMRIMILDVASSGRTAGSLYAFSTLGSIVGTFLSAFVLIPFWGTRETIYLAAIILLLLAALGLKKKPIFFLLVLIQVLFFFITRDQQIKAVRGVIFERESPYQFIQIVENNNRYELKVNDGLGTQSIYDPDSILVNNYYDYYTILPFFQSPSEAKDALIIGLGGGTISRQYLHLFQDHFQVNIDGVELDPEIIKAAQDHFDLADQKINIYVDDGRNFLKKTDNIYDIIIVDAYSQQIYIPFYMTTIEFFQLTKNHLPPEGILAINVNAASADSKMLVGMERTLNAVFPHVYASPVGQGFNWLVLASSAGLDFKQMKKNVDLDILEPVATEVILNMEEVNVPDSINFFTDNQAPIEFLTEQEIYNYIFGT